MSSGESCGAVVHRCQCPGAFVFPVFCGGFKESPPNPPYQPLGWSYSILMNMYTNVFGADVMFFLRRLTTVHPCETRRDPMRLSSERIEKEEGIDIHIEQRWGGLPPLRTMCAKHWPQKGKRGGGLSMRCWYEYTFRRLVIMDASPFLGLPVGGSSAARQAKSCKSARLVVTKSGAVPLYGRGVA